MKTINLKNFLLGSVLAGGLVTGAAGYFHGKHSKEDESKTKTEMGVSKPDKYGNVALFEASRSNIKFALAFVENYYPYVYWCGKAWTTGHGLTILYNDDTTCKRVTKNTIPPTLEQSDIYKDRYLTYDILPDIKEYVKVPMDENTLITACVLRYCVGSKNFRGSLFLRDLNAGKKGAELAKTLTGWRRQEGLLCRYYFFAALMAGKINYSDLLDLRAEGCYELNKRDMLVYHKGRPKCDRKGFYEWDFSKVHANLEKAKKEKTVRLNLGQGKDRVNVPCEKVKDIVPEYVWQEVKDSCSTKKHTGVTIGLIMLLGAGALYSYNKCHKNNKKISTMYYNNQRTTGR